MSHLSIAAPDDEARSVVLTGDRPTGPLHLGHYVGSLRSRLLLQDRHDQFILVADMQALTDNSGDPEKIRAAIVEVVLDYLAVGIDPARSVICLQSGLPALSELTLLYLNLVSVARLERNPTIKAEIQLRGFGRDIPAGFLCYPVSQAADITAFRARLVPVGEDQMPMIELTNEIVRRVNRQADHALLPEARALIPAIGRLPGIDGSAKMSKSQGNALLLCASPDQIRAAVRQMYTDPAHLRVSDPGRVEGNVVFTYLDAFCQDRAEVEALKAHYRAGGLGDTRLKHRLDEILQAFLAPIRARRLAFERDRSFVLDVIRQGTRAARDVTDATLAEIKRQIGVPSI